MTPYEEHEKTLTRLKNSYEKKSASVCADDMMVVINTQLFILDRLQKLSIKGLFK